MLKKYMERVKTEKEYVDIMTKILRDEEGRIVKMRKRLYDEFIRFCREHYIDGEKLIHGDIDRYGGFITCVTYNLVLRDDRELQEKWKEIENNILFPFIISFIKKLGNDDYRLLRYCFYYDKFLFINEEKVSIYNLYSRIKNRNLLTEQIIFRNMIIMDVTNLKRYEKKG